MLLASRIRCTVMRSSSGRDSSTLPRCSGPMSVMVLAHLPRRPSHHQYHTQSTCNYMRELVINSFNAGTVSLPHGINSKNEAAVR